MPIRVKQEVEDAMQKVCQILNEVGVLANFRAIEMDIQKSYTVGKAAPSWYYSVRGRIEFQIPTKLLVISGLSEVE